MKYLTFVAGILLCTSLAAQDFHNWSEQFGGRASLLGGAATAGLGDNGTVYYNAAAMGFVDRSSTSITVNAYRLSQLKLENALGGDLDLTAVNFSTMPNLIAGVLEMKKRPRFSLGYAVLTRRIYSNKLDFLHSHTGDILSSTTGTEIFVASHHWQLDLSEYWGGIAASFRVNDKLAFGLSHFGIYRSMKYSNSDEMTVLPNDGSLGDVASVASNISFNYWNVKILFKPSIALNFPRFRFGMAYTSPTINIMGRANVYRDFSVINLNEVIATDVQFIDRAEKLKTIHKQNGSLAVGLSWAMGERFWMHFSHETFFKQSYFLVFDYAPSPKTYPTQLSQLPQETLFGEQNFLAYGEATIPFTNFGVGLEVKLKPRWEMYVGARTDFNSNANPYYTFNSINVDASKWHLYHFSLGGVHTHKKGKRYTVGLEYGFTPRQEYYHVIDFNTPRPDNALVGDGGKGAFATLNSIKLVAEIQLLKKEEPEINIRE